MRYDVLLPIGDLGRVPEFAAQAEQAAYAGVWTAEAAHDAFLPLALAAPATESITLGTSIAIAFARTPMTLAVVANDLHTLSHGRAILGLGSQIRPHIEKRYSMPWSRPAARMREMVLALRAIWACWHDGVPLDFRGEFYTHTLMTPMFSPGRSPYGAPPVFLAGVGEQMTRVAGEVADGFIVHPFTSRAYLEERILPALTAGLDLSGRTRADLQISFPGFVVDPSDARAFEAARAQMAFYGSTPAYHRVLELHGWLDLGLELNRLSKTGAPDKWKQMAALVPDEVIETVAVFSDAAGARAAIEQRYAGLVDRFTLPPAYVAG